MAHSSSALPHPPLFPCNTPPIPWEIPEECWQNWGGMDPKSTGKVYRVKVNCAHVHTPAAGPLQIFPLPELFCLEKVAVDDALCVFVCSV